MKTFNIKLPKHLHGSYNCQPTISFEASARNHIINGEQYSNPTELHNEFLNPYFKGYLINIMNETIMVTTFDDKDILRGI